MGLHDLVAAVEGVLASINLQFLLELEVEEAFDAAHRTALQLPGDAVAGDLEEAIFQAALPDIL